MFTKESIISFRNKNGWTQKQLAEKINVSVRTIEDWEQGRRTPGRRSLIDFNMLLDEYSSTDAESDK